MKNKSKILKYLLSIIGTAFLVWLIALRGFLFLPTNSRDNQDPAKQQEMMQLVLEWGRLAPIPANASHVIVKTEGSSFTRSFRVRFAAPKEAIQDWIKNSPGLNETVSEISSDGKAWYGIVPGGGASRAEVTIDTILNTVEIYVSWG